MKAERLQGSPVHDFSCTAYGSRALSFFLLPGPGDRLDSGSLRLGALAACVLKNIEDQIDEISASIMLAMVLIFMLLKFCSLLF